jgi:hypothetical protein
MIPLSSENLKRQGWGKAATLILFSQSLCRLFFLVSEEKIKREKKKESLLKLSPLSIAGFRRDGYRLFSRLYTSKRQGLLKQRG